MKKQIFYLIPLAALLLVTACHRNDIRTEIFHIEQLRTPESVQLITKALRPLEGVQKVTPDFKNHDLIVVFNGRALYMKNIEFAIVQAGFSLPNHPASATNKAKLPKELR